MGREEFIRLLTEDQPDPPACFSEDARINREGPEVLDVRRPMERAESCRVG